MANIWYFQADGKKNGPYSDKELKKLADKLVVTPTTLVWKNDMEKWKPASKVIDLFNSDVFDSLPDIPIGDNDNTSLNKKPVSQINNQRKKFEVDADGLFSNTYLLSKINRSVINYSSICICIFVIISGICMPWYSFGTSASFAGMGDVEDFKSIGAFKTSSGVYFSILFLFSIPIQFLPWKISSLVSLGLNGLMLLVLAIGIISVLQGSDKSFGSFGGARVSAQYGVLYGWPICLLGLLGYSVLPYLNFFVFRKNK